MTKQEEIREEIATLSHRYIKDFIKPMSPYDYFNLVENLSKAVVAQLHSQGVVIKKERELPERMFIEGYGYLQSHSAQALLEKSGYVAVEPLIEER